MRFPSPPAVLVLVAAGCTGTDPDDAGTFTAHLTGAAVLTLTGSTNAGVVYTTDAPDGQFTIRMFRVEQGITSAITISCPGQAPPTLGSHSLAPEDGDCSGRYSRFTLEDLTILEEAVSTDGSAQLQRSDEAGAVGTFSFSGVLMEGTESVGDLQVSGSFNAVAGPQ
jgi:hypothetical protein